MDSEPKKPQNPNDLLIITNVDDEDFEWQYDTVRTPLPYFIRAGETRKLPYYIAYHGVNKLIDKMLQKQGKLHTNSIHRDQLMDKIVIGLEHINLVREKTANEIALEEMQRKKDSDPLQELLKRRQIEAEKAREAELARSVPRATVLEHTGMQVAPPTTPLPPSNDPLSEQLNPIDVPTTPPDPVRQEVYNVLMTKGHMDLTHKPTREKLDSTPVDQLRQEFGVEYPELLSTPEPTAPVQMPPDPVVEPTSPPVASDPAAPQLQDQPIGGV